MMKRILCPVDFSESSDYAVWYAHELSLRLGGELHCLHVVDPKAAGGLVEGPYASTGSIDTALERIEEHAKIELSKTVKRFEVMGLTVVGHHRMGRPSAEIVEVAKELDADVVVIATHGRTGIDKLVFGSTCERVVRQSPVPVLSVKHPKHWDLSHNMDEPLEIKRILYPVDFSKMSEVGLSAATLLSQALGASLVLGHVMDNRMDYPLLEAGLPASMGKINLKESKERLEKLAEPLEDIETICRVYSGQPHRSLVAMIEEEKIDLVVMPTHGYQGLSHMLLGSVAERMVRIATCPVLTVRSNHISTLDPAGQDLNEALL